MAAIQIGTAVVWAVPAITSLKTGTTQTAATAATARPLIVTGFSLSKVRQIDETADADGDIVAVVGHGKSESCSIECFPADTTVANAKTANALPEPMDVLKITPSSDTEDADLATAANGYWCITEVSKNRSNTSKATWTLTCRRWGGISDVSHI